MHDTGMRLASEAMHRTVSAPARPRRATSLGLRQEAVLKAGLDKILVPPKLQPRKRQK